MILRLIGQLLRGVRVGERHIAWNNPGAKDAPATLTLTSAAFTHDGAIPAAYAGAGVGDNISPPLTWGNIPAETQELVLFIEDRDVPFPRPMVHTVVYGISPQLAGLEAGDLASPATATARGVLLGKNTLGTTEYRGPRPIPGHGPHTYVFELFALNRRLSFSSPPTHAALREQLRDNTIAKGRLNGTFER